jgi:DNA-binding NarL/FixJ family response regulator
MTMDGPTADTRIRVLLVDDHTVVRQGMRAFFDVLDDIEVVGEAVDGQDAIDRLSAAAAANALPDVVVMDLIMPRLDGIGATAFTKQRHPGVEVVVMTSFSEAGRVHSALEAGAAGYLLKDADADEVGAAVRAAYRGEVHLDAAVAGKLTRSLVSRQNGDLLTTREREALILVAQGKSNRDIARALVISEPTARTHVSNVLTKLGLTSRTQAALWALREGLVHG